MGDLIFHRAKRRNTRPFIISTSTKDLEATTGRRLPTVEDVYKMISLSGGVASVSFIKWVADHEVIEELTASTLRIGEKQFRYIEQLRSGNRLKDARFFTSTTQKRTDAKHDRYNYYKRFEETCEKNGWRNIVINNHSKVILMRTAENHYVLETSSNLNENPKIEQFSFENNKGLYDFYFGFFDTLEEIAQNSEIGR